MNWCLVVVCYRHRPILFFGDLNHLGIFGSTTCNYHLSLSRSPRCHLASWMQNTKLDNTPNWKGKSFEPNHPFSGSMLILGGVQNRIKNTSWMWHHMTVVVTLNDLTWEFLSMWSVCLSLYHVFRHPDFTCRGWGPFSPKSPYPTIWVHARYLIPRYCNEGGTSCARAKT